MLSNVQWHLPIISALGGWDRVLIHRPTCQPRLLSKITTPTTHCSLKMCIHTQCELSSTFWDTLWDSVFWVLFPWVVHGTCSGQWGEREDFQTRVQKARQATLTSTSSYTFWKHVSLFCYKKLVCSLFSRTVSWCFPCRPFWTTDTSVILSPLWGDRCQWWKALSWAEYVP